MKIGKNNIRPRLIVPFCLLIFFILVLCTSGSFILQRYHLNHDVDDTLSGIDVSFNTLLEQETKFMQAQLDFLAKDPSLLSAWHERKRGKLYNAAAPTFKQIKQKLGVTHFYFIGLDQVCFLRVHSPDRNGDRITRHTMKEAAETGNIASGIELGPLGTFTLRVVYPWYVKRKRIGYLELGEEIEHLTPHLAEISGADLIFAIKKEHLDKNKWATGMKILGKKGSWDDFDQYVIVEKTVNAIPDQLQEIIRLSDKEGSPKNVNLTIDGRTCRVAVTPLLDAGNNIVGKLVVLHDITNHIKALQSIMIKSMVILLTISGMVLLFFYIYAGRVQIQLNTYQNHLEKMVAERTRELGDALDEIKTLSGLLPICSYCKKIRDDKGYWNQIEVYLHKHSNAQFTHSICGECVKKHYPELSEE